MKSSYFMWNYIWTLTFLLHENVLSQLQETNKTNPFPTWRWECEGYVKKIVKSQWFSVFPEDHCHISLSTPLSDFLVPDCEHNTSKLYLNIMSHLCCRLSYSHSSYLYCHVLLILTVLYTQSALHRKFQTLTLSQSSNNKITPKPQNVSTTCLIGKNGMLLLLWPTRGLLWTDNPI